MMIAVVKKSKKKNPEEETLRLEKLKAFVKRRFFDERFSLSGANLQIMKQMPNLLQYEKSRVDIVKMHGPMAPCSVNPVLSKEQEQHLFRQYNFLKYLICKRIGFEECKSVKPSKLVEAEKLMARAIVIRNNIATCNFRLVGCQQIRRYMEYFRCNSTREDEYSELYAAIVSSIDYFDWRRNIKFSTYAVWALRNECIKFAERYNRYKDHHAELTPEITAGKIATDAEEDIKEFKENIRLSKKYLDLFKESESRDKYILQRMYGIIPGSVGREGTATLKIVGEEIGVTKERVRQLQERALNRIRSRAGQVWVGILAKELKNLCESS